MEYDHSQNQQISRLRFLSSVRASRRAGERQFVLPGDPCDFELERAGDQNWGNPG